jgi:hypothetical protein
MEILIAILALVLLVVVVLVISAPLRAAWGSQDDVVVGRAALGEARGEPLKERADPDRARAGPAGRWGGSVSDQREPAEERAELEAEREAKYREIRDTELDYRTGKLSQEDFAATDGALRAEAVAILDRLAAVERDEDAPTELEDGPRPRGA